MRRTRPTRTSRSAWCSTTAGDLEARFVVRVKELFESYRLIREILDNLPAGELTAAMPRRITEGRNDQPGRSAARRAVLLHQEQRHRQAGARQGAHAQHVQSGVGV